MSRKRLTQRFPFLLPLRRWQRKKLFYFQMQLDRFRYAKGKSEELLPHLVFESSFLMLNENSGFDRKYQVNKIHNLKLAAKTINKVVIAPNETFSFWQLARRADRCEKYKDGLNLVDGKIVGSYGGGLCLLSDMLFWLFLHTPLTIVERHGHAALIFPSTTEDFPCGTDATISEGWFDLKVCNETEHTFQIEIWFDDDCIHGRIFSQSVVNIDYSVFNSSVSYIRQDKKIYQIACVCRSETDRTTCRKTEKELYVNQCEIAYQLPDEIKIIESGV